MATLGLAAGRPSDSRKSKALAALSDGGGTARVNFDLPVAEHTRLKMHAAKERRSISDILRELIDTHLPK